MSVFLPEIRPISDLARHARQLIERARQRQEPIVITQRGRDVAVLVPIELYRQLESRRSLKLVSPRLARPEDAALFEKKLTVIEQPD